ncbi:MAG: alpha/beta fold hydrolase [Paucibacter sp.]|nr:alpha/beta fold hydrolase [Roseateles sp.]
MKPSVPFVLLHGALNDHRVWAPLTSALPFEFLALDLPGHGAAGGAPLASIGALADWVWQALDARGIDRAVLVGHSMGSLIALDAAARQPARAAALVMVGSCFPMRVAPALLELAANRPDEAIALIDDYSRSQPDPAQQLLQLMRELQAAQHTTNLLVHDLRLCDGYADALTSAAAVTAPTHLILGAEDRMTPPRKAQALGEALRATTHVLPAGHALMAEAPQAIATLLTTIHEETKP